MKPDSMFVLSLIATAALGAPLVPAQAAPVTVEARVNTNATAQSLPFDPEALVKPITELDGILSDGSRSRVYKIVIRSTPRNHPTGPWAPATIHDKGGFWEDTVDKKLYRVDVDYLKTLNARGWDMFDPDGTVHRTRTREAFDKIARQELAGWTFEQAKKDGVVNSVIELQPQDQIVTVFLPKDPKPSAQPTMLRQARFSPRSGVGVSLNGVRYFPPEPVHRITAFQNIAPVDPHGGHTGFGHEYHYHRAPEVMTNDTSGRIAGYALDGFPIRGPTEPDGRKPANLDAINGHDHDGLGYHYHLSGEWPYIVGGFRGPLGTAVLGDASICDATQQQGGPPAGRAGAARGDAGGPPGDRPGRGNGPPLPRGGPGGRAP